MPESIIDHHRRFWQQHATFVEREEVTLPAAHWLHCDIATEAGSGWMDACEISHGLTIGRSHYALNAPWQCDYSESHDVGLAVYVLLSGRVEITLENESCPQTLSGAAICLCDHARTPERMYFQQAAVTPFQGVTFTLPKPLVEELTADAPALASFAQRPGYLPLPRGQAGMSMMQIAQQMLEIPAHTSIGRLHLESRALELTALMAGLLQMPAAQLPHHQQIAVDEARDILEREWMGTHTISGLSRRVQLNECYLKSAFRVSTGHSIGQYLRRVRMRHARRLLEDTPASVLQTAAFVGYSNPSHFARAFKGVYGMSPSALKR